MMEQLFCLLPFGSLLLQIFRFLFDVGEFSYSFQIIDPKFNHDV